MALITSGRDLNCQAERPARRPRHLVRWADRDVDNGPLVTRSLCATSGSPSVSGPAILIGASAPLARLEW